MCYAAIPYIAMAIGTAATVAGQNQQRNEAKRAQAAQDQFNAMQKFQLTAARRRLGRA